MPGIGSWLLESLSTEIGSISIKWLDLHLWEAFAFLFVSYITEIPEWGAFAKYWQSLLPISCNQTPKGMAAWKEAIGRQSLAFGFQACKMSSLQTEVLNSSVMLLRSFCFSLNSEALLANLLIFGSGAACLRHSENMSQVLEKWCGKLECKEVLKKKKERKERALSGYLSLYHGRVHTQHTALILQRSPCELECPVYSFFVPTGYLSDILNK